MIAVRYSSNIEEILKIKENFPSLSSKKIKKVYRTIKKLRKDKTKLNMIFKRPLRRQVIVPMSLTNISKSMVLFGKYMTNINKALKNIKSDIMTDFIKADQQELTIMTNKVALTLDLSTIKKYIKNIDVMDSENIMSPWLFQSKSHY